MATPIITTLTENNPRTNNKMSHVAGYNTSIVTIAFDQAITKYSVNRGGSNHYTGVILASGTITKGAGESWTINIADTQLLEGSNTINFYGMNANGEWSDGTNDVAGYRYLRIDGYGEYYSATSYYTTRMIEVEVFSGGTNVLAGLVGSAGQPVDFGVTAEGTTITKVTDGVKTTTGYDGWWSNVTVAPPGNGWVKYDLGAMKTINSIRYWSYPARAPRFKIYGTNNSADFGASGTLTGSPVLLWDTSANTTNIGATAGTDNYIEKAF
jgi:hypothetical protein